MTRILEAGIDPHLLNHKGPIRVTNGSNESIFMDELVLTRTPTPPTPLLSHVSINSSSPMLSSALNGCCLLVSVGPTTSYRILLACVIKSSMEDSDANERTL
uniref:Ovule protein n=1 Tax=Angiostrongylus cantonensis TaxID=6313 RepID=A0A0K0DGP2_ANGCA